MKRITITALVLLATFASGSGEPFESIRQFINTKSDHSRYEIDNEYLLSGNVLSFFYANRNYTPAWFTHNTLSNNGYALIDYIRQVDQQGLQPEDYHLNLIGAYVGKILCYFKPINIADLMKMDILLTDAFMLLGSHLYYGKVDPEKEGANWKMERKDPELRLDLKLEEALAGNDVGKELNMLAPRYRAYWMMKEELAFFLKLNEQLWPAILSDIAIKPGESNLLLPKIRERLIKLRYQLSDSISITFDGELEKQLKMFQDDWGLNTDGVIGKSTLEDLNSLPFKLISQLKVNMERYRWLPLQVTEKYIIINIANFKLDLIAGTDTLISMRAIVGKEPRKTPVFNERISYIVFSPSWTVPRTILQDDVIPELLKGPEYLEKRNMKLLRHDGSELAYSDIDWSTISKNNFPYTVRQNPGPGNALGKVKFMFPNTYDVYIHDTPSKGSFTLDDRNISSGCVRVEKPFDLAVLLLSDSPEWSPANILNAMQQDKEQTVRLKIPVDVVLIYLTAWTDGKDRVQFRKDVYQRDDIVLVALNQKPDAIKVKLL
ncbi:MAG: L,D-transpeptidase YcbB [Bacteroidota bacterium]|nr:L,D-transpeptidase YcbB [Bacteroidota bacterium]